MSGGTSFGAEQHEMQLPTSMAPSVPLSLISEEQHSQPMRSQYTYVQSTNPPRQLSVSASAPGGPSSGVNVPRYMDEARPPKSSHGAGHQSVHSSGSMANSETPSEYRYSSYAAVNNGTGDVSSQNYGSETSGASHGASRDVYPPPATWTTTAGEPAATGAYASHDGRPYASPYDHYKSGSSGSQVKVESSQTSHADAYSGGPRGSFDAMNNYSWSSS
jgi:hypothetical protein